MKVCPKCHSELPDDVAFCTSCGERLTQNKWKCASCGAINSESDLFCGNCGQRCSDVGDNHGVTAPNPNYENQYQVVKNTLSGSPSEEALSDAIIQLESLGDYKDARVLLEKCRKDYFEILYNRACKKLEQAETNHTIYYELEKEFAKLGDYKDSIEKYNKCKEFCDRERKRKKKVGIILGSSIVAAIAVIAVLIKIVIPTVTYASAEKALSEGRYERAISDFSRLGAFKDSEERTLEAYYQQGIALIESGEYANAVESLSCAGEYSDAPTLIKKAYYLHGCDLLTSGSFEDAITSFISADDYEDAKQQIRISYYEQGKDLLGKNQFEPASAAFSNAKSYEDSAKYYNYAKGRAALEKKSYSEAVSFFSSAKDIEDGESRFIESNYSLAEQELAGAKYSDAKKHYAAAGKYEDAEKKISICDLMIAENNYKQGNLSAALDGFASVPDDLTYKDVSASKRKEVLNANKSIVNACGKWEASKNYIEARNVYSRTGSWDGWYIDTPMTFQTIEVHFVPQNDGTFTMRGSLSFYRYTYYSSLKSLCETDIATRNFSIPNLTSVPTSYSVDSNTTLKYSNGVFSLSYSKKDSYSTSFYNKYNTSVTYGKKVSTF